MISSWWCSRSAWQVISETRRLVSLLVSTPVKCFDNPGAHVFFLKSVLNLWTKRAWKNLLAIESTYAYLYLHTYPRLLVPIYITCMLTNNPFIESLKLYLLCTLSGSGSMLGIRVWQWLRQLCWLWGIPKCVKGWLSWKVLNIII